MKKIFLSKPDIGQREKKAVLEVLDSGILASNVRVKQFEDNFSQTINVKNSIAVSNGTVALHASLLALGVKEHDEIITTPFTFIATSNSILFCKARPVFCDIDPKTFNLDPNKAEDVLKKNKKIKGIIIVHLYGLPADMNAFKYLSKKYKVFLVEDCAQSVGSLYKNQYTGSFGDIGTFSFYATKNIMTGEGGMITTNNSELADKVRKIINHGRTGRFSHGVLGYNFRLTDLAASIGIVQLDRLNEFTNKRIKNAEFYNNNLKNIPWIKTPNIPKNCKHVFHQYTILVPKEERDNFIKYLNDNGIDAAAIYPLSLPEQPLYADMGYKPLPISFDISKRVVSLPAHPRLEKNDMIRVVNTIKNYKNGEKVNINN